MDKRSVRNNRATREIGKQGMQKANKGSDCRMKSDITKRGVSG